MDYEKTCLKCFDTLSANEFQNQYAKHCDSCCEKSKTEYTNCKTCSRCYQVKDITEFKPRRNGTFTVTCIVCLQYVKEHDRKKKIGTWKSIDEYKQI